ncbi:death ligand signal enhancer [Pristis pectinata]|uniref:death ligand signal enhancer n=1 Tax=Pristis pectinata TaxID=685728 RepID=UPI00223E0FDB|nr:death ligand signal enhancer [Pristis pectinata]
MWRVKAALGRVFHRWPTTGPSTSLRLPPTHCTEDDLLNPPVLVPNNLPSKYSSTDPQNGDGRERREEEEQKARFYSKPLPRFSGLDAVGWGAAAVMLLQFVRHLHRQFCHHNGPQESDVGLRLCLPDFVASTLTPDRISKFTFYSMYIGPEGDIDKDVCTACPDSSSDRCILPHGVGSDAISSSAVPTSALAGSSPPADDTAVLFKIGQENFENVEQDDPLFMESAQRSDYSVTDGSSRQLHPQREGPNSEEALNQATSDLQGTTESSISSILNIIGIENIRAKDDDMAFSCFMMAARQGYSKAQYNVGVCYELGRGTAKDIEKAALYYSQAATQGTCHGSVPLGQVFCWRSSQEGMSQMPQRAVEQFEKAGKSGLREAQAYLGVFYTNEPHQDPQQAVRYFTMASRNGDPMSQYHLGICYQRGWGVLKD